MWEYRFETVRVKASYLNFDNALLKDRVRLEKLGYQGWEAVSMIGMDVPGDILILFKRQKYLSSQRTVEDALVSQGIMENSL